jgi:hypothetical protein
MDPAKRQELKNKLREKLEDKQTDRRCQNAKNIIFESVGINPEMLKADLIAIQKSGGDVSVGMEELMQKPEFMARVKSKQGVPTFT